MMPNALTPDQRKIQELEKRIKRIETEKEILKKLPLSWCRTRWTICDNPKTDRELQCRAIMWGLRGSPQQL